MQVPKPQPLTFGNHGVPIDKVAPSLAARLDHHRHGSLAVVSWVRGSLS